MTTLTAEEAAAFRIAARARVVQAEGPKAHTGYQTRPVDWIADKLGVPRHTLVWSENDGYEGHEWDGDEDPIAAMLEALASGEDVGVSSAPGTGKSFALACALLWFLACFPEALVVTIAPKQDQLLKQMWMEVGRLFDRFQRHFPSATLISGELRMKGGTDDSWAAIAYACGVGKDEASAVKAQGWHREHMLVIVEEGPGVHTAVWKALDLTRTGEHNLEVGVGNPVGEGDPLDDWCRKRGVRHVTVSALDHPNVVTGREIVPGAVGRKAVAQRRADYSHEPSILESRIHGRFPSKAVGAALHVWSPDLVVPFGREAQAHAVQKAGWHVYLGLDPGDRGWAYVVGLVDPKARMTVVAEGLSRREVLEARYGRLSETLGALFGGETVRLTGAWYDSAAASEGRELNKLLREDESARWRISASVKKAIKGAQAVAVSYRAGFVIRANQLMHEGRLRFASSLDEDAEPWREGADGTGREHTGSRLLWEIRRWRYPDDERRVRRDPDDDSADGAHAIAALRYLVMGWAGRGAPSAAEQEAKEKRAREKALGLPREARGLPPQREGNVDLGLERMAAIEKRRKRRTRG